MDAEVCCQRGPGFGEACNAVSVGVEAGPEGISGFPHILDVAAFALDHVHTVCGSQVQVPLGKVFDPSPMVGDCYGSLIPWGGGVGGIVAASW